MNHTYEAEFEYVAEGDDTIGYVEYPEERKTFEYFGSPRLKVDGEEVDAELENVEINADEIIEELEAEDEEINFLEAGTLRHGME